MAIKKRKAAKKKPAKKKKIVSKVKTVKRKKVAVKKVARKGVRKKAVRKPPRKKTTVKKRTVAKKTVKKVVAKKKRRRTVKEKIGFKKIKRKVVRVAKKAKKRGKSIIRRIGRGGGTKQIQDKLLQGAVVVGGVVSAGVIANMVPIKEPRIKAALPIIAGIILSTTKPFRGNLGQGLTMGMIAAGGLAMVKQFAPNVPLLAGEDELLEYMTPEEERAAMLGYYPEDDDYQDIDDALEGDAVDIGEEDDDWQDPGDM